MKKNPFLATGFEPSVISFFQNLLRMLNGDEPSAMTPWFKVGSDFFKALLRLCCHHGTVTYGENLSAVVPNVSPYSYFSVLSKLCRRNIVDVAYIALAIYHHRVDNTVKNAVISQWQVGRYGFG